MSLIGRYIFREVFTSTLIVLVVLLVIFMSNQFAETLGDAAADELPRAAIFTVLGLQFLRFLALLAPIAILLGVLLGLARLNRDSEIAALAACGAGPARLLWPIGVLSLMAAAGVAWLSLIKAPAASRSIEEIRHRAQQEVEFGPLRPDRFTSINGGSTIIHARAIDGESMEGVFIRSYTEQGVDVAVAERAERVMSEDDSEIVLRLFNGSRYQGVPGEAAFHIAEFAEQGIPIRRERQAFDAGVESLETRSLLGSTDASERAELQWRLGAPLSLLILGLLALPLGRSSPREGKYARVGIGLLVYLIYANTLSIARVWVERDLLPVWLGTWWVHGLLLLLAGAMLLRQSGLRPSRAGGKA